MSPINSKDSQVLCVLLVYMAHQRYNLWACMLLYALALSLFFHGSVLADAFEVTKYQQQGSMMGTTSFTFSNRHEKALDTKSRQHRRLIGPLFSSLNSGTDDALLDAYLSVAVDAAKRAGEVILSHGQGAEVVDHKANSRDLLTVVDPLCEKIIKETIHGKFPEHRFLGEEDVEPGNVASAKALQKQLESFPSVEPLLWIVDPIDGTTNFVHGMPLCMPSIALVDTLSREIIVGVIYDCHRDELFTAVKDRGASMNGNPIHVGPQKVLGDAVVAMGSPPAIESYSKSLLGIQYLMPKVRTIRMLGSAALMLAWVANGRLTAYWEYDLSSWDTAAGVLLITEAGGTVTDLKGDPFTVETRQLCASNGAIHSKLIQTLRDEAGIV